ncbi:MAG: TonB-dependent receptor, partial [Proteobacteria bacterium]|nr:TonB-dependent receptor [Pseudomonadota bacterium]
GGLGAGATLADYMANEASYNIGAYSSENNADSKARLDAMRFDGSYVFDDGGFITSIDVGVRRSQREVQEERFHYFSPFYAEQCGAQWKATDVKLHTGACQAGENVNGAFEGYTVLPPTALGANNNVIWVTDFGPVGSIPGVWAVDPADYDDPAAFHTRVFGSVERRIIPGTSYDIDLDETTYYAQVNFESGKLSGNLGVRVVETEKIIKQNIAGAGIPYGNTNVDDGDTVTRVKYTDTLPALNLAYDVTDDFRLRFGAAKTMTPLDLNFWGDGLAIQTSFNQDLGFFVVNQASLGGNPDLDPWRASNFDLSAEWYLGSASMVSAALFYVDIESFVDNGTIPMQFPDPDGIVRRTINVSAPIEGDGGTIEGAELAGRVAFSDFTDGFISDFGIDANYTYSPSEQNATDISGAKLPFPENSEDQVNFIVWYENDAGFQARVAYNYRSDRLRERGRTSGNLTVYQDAVDYVDVSASYDINDNMTVFLQGSNVTGSYEDYYMQWQDQYAYQNYYEPRFTVGVRGRW